MSFDVSKHMMNLKGKPYLPVAWRLVWFRSEHADWSLETEALVLDFEGGRAVFRAVVKDSAGRTIATATKTETLKDFPDFMEKAETGAIGRALGLCGYGTQYAPEFDEEDRLADAPVQRPQRPPVSERPAHPTPRYSQSDLRAVAEKGRGQGNRYDAPMSPPRQPAPAPAKQAVDDFLGDPDALFNADEVTTKPARTSAIAGGM